MKERKERKKKEKLTNKHSLIDMKVLRTLEALRRALLDVSNMFIGEVLGDACIANSMVEDVAWVCESLSYRNGQVDLGHVLLVSSVEPLHQLLLDIALLVSEIACQTPTSETSNKPNSSERCSESS